MSILINDGKCGEENIGRCDIGEFVLLVEKLKRQMAPLVKVLNTAIAIFRWEKPLVTIVAIICMCWIFIVNPVYMVLLVLLPIPPWLVVEYFRMSYRQNRPNKMYMDYVQRKDETYQQYLKQAAQEKQKERLALFLDILVGLQRIFVDMADYFEYLHSVITWKRKRLSLLLLLSCLVMELSVYMLDIRVVLCTLTIAFFFVNVYFVRAVKRCGRRCRSILTPFSQTPTPKKTKTESLSFERSPDAVVVPFSPEKIATMQPEEVETSSTESDEDTSDKKEDMSANSSSRNVAAGGGFAMSMFIPRSLRQRYMAGNCYKCDQPSSSILKKRRYCRHCGNSFCSRCCSIRVPRAFLGATAPAAYQEKVLVCENCHVFLTNRMKTTESELVGE